MNILIEDINKYFDKLSKNISEELSVEKKARLNKLVRRIIYTIYTDTPGTKNAYFSDPNMYRNKLRQKYISGYKKGLIKQDFKDWIYLNRHKFFDREFQKYLNLDNYTEEEREYMQEYYENLTSSDYSRNLYLTRDSAEIKKNM